MIKIYLILTITITSVFGYSQQGENIFGFQYKPIVPNKFIGEYERNFDSLPIFKSRTKQKFGHSFGMILRHYFKDNVALESGINFTKTKIRFTF